MAAGMHARGGVPATWSPSARWNFVVFGSDIAFFTLGLSISSSYTVLPLFVHHLMPNNVAVALISAVRALGMFTPQLVVASLVERRMHALPLILRLTVLERVPYLLLALATLWLARSHAAALLVVFYALIFIALLGSGLTSPPWLDMIARSVPSSWLGRFFGLWAGVGGVLGIGGGAVAAELLARVAWPLNFALCFVLTFATMVISFVLLSRGREPMRATAAMAPYAAKGQAVAHANKATPEVRAQAAALWHVLQGDAGLRRLIGSNAIAGVATMAAALFAVAALRSGGLTTAQVGAESTLLFVGSTGGYFLWGAVGDHFGHRAVLVWGSICAAASAALALWAHGFVAYALVFLLLGLNIAAVNLAALTFITEFGPPARRPTYIALVAVAYAPFAVGAPVLGGWLANLWGYPLVFALSAVAGLGSAAAYQWLVPDPRRRPQPLIR